MNNLINFSIDQKWNQKNCFTTFRNDSPYKVFISEIPVKPKRKYKDLIVLLPNEFMIIEDFLDVTKISISFQEVKND